MVAMRDVIIRVCSPYRRRDREARQMLPTLEELQALPACRDPQGLNQAVEALARRMGVCRWVYVRDLSLNAAPAASLILGGYPEAWVQHYTARDYVRIDPVVSHCRA